MIARSSNRLLLHAQAHLAEAQEKLAKATDEPKQPGRQTRLLDAQEAVRYWQRRVQEMESGG